MPAATFIVVIDTTIELNNGDVRDILVDELGLRAHQVLVSKSTDHDRVVAGLAGMVPAADLQQLLGTIATMQETDKYQRLAHQALNDNLTAVLRRVVALETKVFTDG